MTTFKHAFLFDFYQTDLLIEKGQETIKLLKNGLAETIKEEYTTGWVDVKTRNGRISAFALLTNSSEVLTIVKLRYGHVEYKVKE